MLLNLLNCVLSPVKPIPFQLALTAWGFVSATLQTHPAFLPLGELEVKLPTRLSEDGMWGYTVNPLELEHECAYGVVVKYNYGNSFWLCL